MFPVALVQREVSPVKQVRLRFEIDDDAGLEGLEAVDGIKQVELQVDVSRS